MSAGRPVPGGPNHFRGVMKMMVTSPFSRTAVGKSAQLRE
jgi:hypothetical protein